jgi:hypothetical protein
MALLKTLFSKIDILINGSNNYNYYYNTPVIYDFARLVLNNQAVSVEYSENFNLLRDKDQGTLSSLKREFGNPYFKKKSKGLTVYGFKVKSFGLKVKVQVGFKDKKIVCIYKNIYGKEAEMKELDIQLRLKYKILGGSRRLGYMNKQVFNCYSNQYFNQIELIQIFNFDLMKNELNEVIQKLEVERKSTQKKRNEFIKEIA